MWCFLRHSFTTLLSALLAFGLASEVFAASPEDSAAADTANARPRTRGFRTFQPRQGDVIESPAAQVVQLLLDRQAKEGYESYLIQVLFRGKPPSRRDARVLADRVEIDFLDTGKPSMRLAKIRGGAVEASALDELYYRDPGPGSGAPRLRRMVRLTLFMRPRAELKFRDTLDRTLILFRLANP